MRFEFRVEVEIPDDESEEFLAAFEERHFDFFRYLAENQAKITREEPPKEEP